MNDNLKELEEFVNQNKEDGYLGLSSEMIQLIEKLIADFKHFQEMREKDKELNIYQWNSYDDIFKEYKQAIQGILDLYQKEKEKNKYIEVAIKTKLNFAISNYEHFEKEEEHNLALVEAGKIGILEELLEERD